MKFSFNRKKDDNTSEDINKQTSSIYEVFEKLTTYFDPQPQKEKVLRHDDFNRAGDTYYASVSAGYKISQRILTVILAVFLMFSLLTNFKNITFDNLFYFLKDFSNAMDIEQSDYDTVSYSSDTRHFFSLYRNGLVVVDSSNIAAFTATGRNTLQTTSQFSSPCVVSSDKYFLVYDTAGTTFSVYNAFSRVYSENFDYPVTDACFGDNGSVAIITKDISHKSVVYLYSKSFDKKLKIPCDKYAFDVCVSDETKQMAICYYDIGDGSGVSEICVRSTENADIVKNIEISGEFLLKCGFLSKNRFVAITDDSIRIYDKNFEEIDRFEYFNANVSGYSISPDGVAVAYSENSKNMTIVFDKSGNMLYNNTISDTVKDIGICDRFVFLRTDSGIIRIDTMNDEEEYLPSDQGRMLIYNANTALVCGISKAEYLVFGN